MARYEWPPEFNKPPDRLAQRAERALRTTPTAIPPGMLGDLDLLDDVIEANFEAERKWMPLGPSIMTNGQAARDPVVAGRVRDIRVSPDGNRVYVATANGGVWYSPNKGVRWEPLGAAALDATTERSNLSLTIGALLVEFGAAAADDVVYVGTGEPSPWVFAVPGAKHGGVGILRLNGTVDAALADPRGNPWQREARNLARTGIFRLARKHDEAPLADGTATLVAATTKGPYIRTGAFSDNADWDLIDLPVDTYTNRLENGAYCPDVVWNDKGLWLTLVGAGSHSGNPLDGVYHSPAFPAGTFRHFPLPNHLDGSRVSLGEATDTNRMYVLGRINPPGAGNAHSHLWQIDLTRTPVVAEDIADVPVGLFSGNVTKPAANLVVSGSDQGDYDQAIAVRRNAANTRDIVTVGGSYENPVPGEPNPNNFNATLFDLVVRRQGGNLITNFEPARQTNAEQSGTFTGAGIHADVHKTTIVGNDIWVGCDGGVFLKPTGSPARSRNAGLAVAEPGYIASHPVLDGPVLAGTQDNGVIQRIGDTVWSLQRKGDGGGVAFHPTRPFQRIMQYISSSWNFEPDNFVSNSAVSGRSPPTVAGGNERNNAFFYSKPAVAPATAPNDARLFIGTDRLWYCDNWNTPTTQLNWVTVPTGTNPGNNEGQDQLSIGSDVDQVLSVEILQQGDPAQNYLGTAILLLCTLSVRIFRLGGTAAAPVWSSANTSVISNDSGQERPKEKKVPDDDPDPFLPFMPKKNGSVWTDVAVHDASTPGQETLYLTTTGHVTSDPGTGDLVGDPTFDTLWWFDGQGRWYPTGLRNAPLDPAAGTGGSPSSAYSVTVLRDGTRDLVYVGNRIGVFEGQINRSGTHPSWTWKPVMDGLPHTIVEDLDIASAGSSTFLRAALVSRGIWERDLSASPTSVGRTFIRTVPFDTGRSELPDPVTNPLTDPALPTSALTFHESPDIIIQNSGAQVWDPDPPHEADLMAAQSVRRPRRRMHSIFVMVHHRDTTPVAADDVNIDLFLQRNAPSGGIDGFSMTGAVRTAIRETVAGNSPAMSAGLTHIGRFRPDGPVDARTPRTARVEFNLNVVPRREHAMLIAVVTSPDNALTADDLAPANLRDVVRRSARVAVRKFRMR
ncbi:hypothetical protein [uncultured Roseobacter sp.]|uniref:hypothetical protein n=1 Tax=uncultured Roseobacter sp. TaxID=114847 RepID=UPI00262CCDE2|nr:hypothetical protein [uncultured Roseobacter sp.]